MKLKENLQAIESIKRKYDCKGKLIFRTALSNLMDYGKNNYNDEEYVVKEKVELDKYYEEVEKQGTTPFISKGIQLAIIDCSCELAKVPHWDLFEYIQVCMQPTWVTPSYQQLGKTIGNLLGIIQHESNDGDIQSTIDMLEEWSVNSDILEYLGYNEFVREEEE